MIDWILGSIIVIMTGIIIVRKVRSVKCKTGGCSNCGCGERRG